MPFTREICHESITRSCAMGKIPRIPWTAIIKIIYYILLCCIPRHRCALHVVGDPDTIITLSLPPWSEQGLQRKVNPGLYADTGGPAPSQCRATVADGGPALRRRRARVCSEILGLARWAYTNSCVRHGLQEQHGQTVTRRLQATACAQCPQPHCRDYTFTPR